MFRARPGQTLDKYAQNPVYGALALLQWLLLRKGPMACIPAQVGSFTRLDDKRQVPPFPFCPTSADDLSAQPAIRSQPWPRAGPVVGPWRARS